MVRTVSSMGTVCLREFFLRWSTVTLWAMRKSQAPMGDALPLEGADGLEGANEYVLGEVLGVKAVADAGDDVCVDPVEVVFVDLLEGRLAAGLGAFDKLLLGLHRVSLGGGAFRGNG